MLKKISLNMQVLGQALLLLAVTLGILAYFSQKALRHEAQLDAEQVLEGTVQDIDNILYGVELSANNIYYELEGHLDKPEMMYTYSRKLVESNPDIEGCAIAFMPNYYPDRDLFMAYVHRKAKTKLVESETFANRPYTEQEWFQEPMNFGFTGWINPLRDNNTDKEPTVCFCLPITDKTGERIGVMAVDVSITHLSGIISSVKSSERGYSVLLAGDGSYIVHPDKTRLLSAAALENTDADPTEIEVCKAMLAGESGMKQFSSDGRDWYAFYKPFKRVRWQVWSSGEVGWSVGVVYPKDDVTGSHNTLIYLAMVIAIVGLLLFYLFCRWFVRRQLKPLEQLTTSTQHIADGNYSATLPETTRHDEVGMLQNRFVQMQHSLHRQAADLGKETSRQHQKGLLLQAAYDKTIETDNLRNSFLHYMTNQIATIADGIDSSVTTLVNSHHNMDKKDADRHADNIKQGSQTIVELLGLMAHFTDKKGGQA